MKTLLSSSSWRYLLLESTTSKLDELEGAVNSDPLGPGKAILIPRSRRGKEGRRHTPKPSIKILFGS